MHHAAAAACSTATFAFVSTSAASTSAASISTAAKTIAQLISSECCCRKGKCRSLGHFGSRTQVEELGWRRPRANARVNTTQASGSNVLLLDLQQHPRRLRCPPGDRVGFGSGFRTSPSYTMFRRTVASSASVPRRLSPSTSTLSDDRACVTYFRSLLDASEDSGSVDAELLWEKYDSIETRMQLSRAEIIRLAKVVMAGGDFWPKIFDSDSKEGPALWARRLQGLVHELRNRQAELDTEMDGPLGYIEAVAYALRGDFKRAIQLFASFSDSNSLAASWRHNAFRHILMSTIVNDSVDAATDFWLRYEASVVTSPSVRDSRRRKQRWEVPFRLEISRLLEVASNPVELLRSSYGHYGFQTLAKFASQMLHVMCHERLVKDALAVFAWCNERRIELHFDATHALIKALTNAAMFEEANETFASLEPKGSASSRELDSYSRTGVRLYAHQGDVDRVRQYARYDGDATYLMHAHAIRGEAEDAVKLFYNRFMKPTSSKKKKVLRKIKKPEIRHFSVIIHAFVVRNDVDGINHWFSLMLKEGIEPDVVVYNTILKGFSQQGDIEKMSGILDRMRRSGCAPNLHSYTLVMKVLARRRDVLAAEALLKLMVREGITPDRQVITTLMNAHVEAGSWKGVIRVFDYLRNSPVREHSLGIEVFNTLLKAYVLIGAPLEVVTKIFRTLEISGVRPTSRTFALLVQSACQSGRMDIAYRLLEQMEARSTTWTSNVQVTIEVLTIIMNAHLRTGDRVKARAVYNDMVSRGLKPTANTFASILVSYTTASFPDNIKLAQEFLDTIASSPEASEILNHQQSGRESSLTMVYSPLLNAYAKDCDVEMIEKICSDLIARGEQPSVNVLGYVLDAYRRSGDIEGVQRLWPQILQLALKRTDEVDALLTPHDTQSDFYKSRRRSDLLCVALSIYIVALSHAGLHLEIAHAWNTLREHGFQFDAHNWNHLVVALVRAGEPMRAFEVVEKVIIPYSVQSRHIMRERSEDVSSPLLFDDADSLEEIADEPFTVPIARTRKKRDGLVELIRRRFDGMSEMEDLAHDLQILQQISPEWCVWKIHEATFTALSSALWRLESGKRVRPQTPSQDTDEEEQEQEEDDEEEGNDVTKIEAVNGEEESTVDIADEKPEAEAARETFLFILSNYRKTVVKVEEWLREHSQGAIPSTRRRS